jgi:hypothetical protein
MRRDLWDWFIAIPGITVATYQGGDWKGKRLSKAPI